MSILKYVMGIAVAVAITACGGGGGNPGAASGAPLPAASAAALTPIITVPTISLAIVDSNGTVVSSNAIGSGALFYVNAIVKNASGNVVANKLVTFATNSAVSTFVPASALTDLNGVAKVQIIPASVTAVNAGNLVASTTVDTVPVSASLDYQTSAANVSLTTMLVASSPIIALQSSAVTVEGRVNGVLAGSSVVSVNFSAPCGTFSPNPARTGSDGIARTTYQSIATCSGPVTLTSHASGATDITTIVSVTAAQPANVVFSLATVPLMVSSAATGGLKQSIIKFQVLDGNGVGMTSPQNLSMTLSSATISAGVTFSDGTTAAHIVPTDGSGFASVTVSSGGLPTPVIVTATLVNSNPVVQASSSNVAVTSGRATQNAASLSATKLSIEAFDVDGVQTTLTMRVADRQGNPVPDGSIVNFTTGSGLVQGTCSLVASQCSVTYTSQGLRPANGRVAILAYMDGEESFIDLNGDNIWRDGSNGTVRDPFFAVGRLYRDDNENFGYDATEQTYPGGTTGSSPCASDVYSYPSVANSCDATNWSSSIRVRQQIVIALGTQKAIVSLVAPGRTLTKFTVHVTDLKGNSMPTGTTVAAAVVTPGAACTVSAVSPAVVNNSSNGGDHVIVLNGATDCGTVSVNVTVTAPSQTATVVGF